MTTVAQLAASLIHVFEGCRLSEYKDSGGVPTIGFGHTSGVEVGQTITMEQAVAFFEEDCKALISLVSGKPILEAGALVSFGYNCGIGSLRRYLAGEVKLEDFTKDHRGNVLPGLEARRTLESLLIEVSRGG